MSKYLFGLHHIHRNLAPYQDNPDDRSLPEKALGLIYAMTNDQAIEFHKILCEMRSRCATDKRATMFIGEVLK